MKGCKIGTVLEKIDGIDIWSVKCGARYPNYYLSGPRYRNGLKEGQRKNLDQIKPATLVLDPRYLSDSTTRQGGLNLTVFRRVVRMILCPR